MIRKLYIKMILEETNKQQKTSKKARKGESTKQGVQSKEYHEAWQVTVV